MKKVKRGIVIDKDFLKGEFLYLVPKFNREHIEPLFYLGLDEGSVVLINPFYSLMRGIVRNDAEVTRMSLRSFYVFFRLFFEPKSIILSCVYDNSMLVVWSLHSKKITLFHTSYCHWDLWPSNPLRRFIAKKFIKGMIESSSAAITVSTKATESVIANFGHESSSVWTIPHALGDSFLSIDSNTKRRSKRILFAGRLVEEKGVADVVEIAERLGVRVGIMGDGPLRKDLTEGVDYHGYVKKECAARMFAEYDILCLPSRKRMLSSGLLWEELFGLVIIEALSLGLCVVTTKHAGPEHLANQYPVVLLGEENFVDDFCEIYRNNVLHFPKEIDVQSIREEFGVEELARKWKVVMLGSLQ